MELTILMPCLNESETIVTCIKKAKNFLMQNNINGEILIADNGSNDDSQILATKNGARVIHVPIRGYGAALKAGINAAYGKYIIMGDADDSYDFLNLMPFLKKLRAGNELVMGNRFKGGIKTGAMPFLNKYLGNPVLSFIGRLFFKSSIGDFHCGLRGFQKEAIQRLNLQALGMEFASEMIVKAALKRITITEVPTILSPDGRSHPPHLRKWHDGWRHLKLLLLLSPRWLFLYPGLALSVVGFFLMIILAITPLSIGPCTFSIHTMLFGGAFFVVGLQGVVFSLFGNLLTNESMELPFNSKVDNFFRQYTVERGIFIGMAFALLGILGSMGSLWLWKQANFGALVPTETMRLAIPSVIFFIAGMQIIFSSFFAGLLRMRLNPTAAQDANKENQAIFY